MTKNISWQVRWRCIDHADTPLRCGVLISYRIANFGILWTDRGHFVDWTPEAAECLRIWMVANAWCPWHDMGVEHHYPT